MQRAMSFHPVRTQSQHSNWFLGVKKCRLKRAPECCITVAMTGSRAVRDRIFAACCFHVSMLHYFFMIGGPLQMCCSLLTAVFGSLTPRFWTSCCSRLCYCPVRLRDTRRYRHAWPAHEVLRPRTSLTARLTSSKSGGIEATMPKFRVPSIRLPWLKSMSLPSMSLITPPASWNSNCPPA